MWLLTLRDLRYRLVRFLVVTVGTALVFTLLFLMTGLVEQFNQEPFLTAEAIADGYWSVPDGVSGPFTSSSTLDPDQVEAVGGEALLIARGTLVIDEVASEGIVIGHEPGGLVQPPLEDGRRADDPSEAVVDISTGLEPGDSFSLGEITFDVVGTTDDTTLLAGQPSLFLTLEGSRSAMFGGAPVTMTVLTSDPPPAVEGVTVLTTDDVAEDALGPLENAISSVDLIRVLLWVVAGIIIGAVVYLSALERQRDFAVLLAVGGKARQLSISLAIQAVLVALVAVGLAALIQALVVPVFPLKVRVPTRALWQLPAVAVIVSLVAASFAMRRVRRTDPAQAFGGPA